MKTLVMVVNNPAFFLSHRLIIAQEARRQGYEVVVATMPSPAVAQIKAEGFRHEPLPMSRSGMNPLQELNTLWHCWRLFRRLAPDVVHLVTIKPLIYGGIAARWAKVPAVVYAVAGMGYLFHQPRQRVHPLSGLIQALMRRGFAHPNSRVIVQNHDDAQRILALTPIRQEQLALIPGSGVDLSRYVMQAEPATPPIVVTMASRLLKDKGVLEFVAAAKRYAQHAELNPDLPQLVWQLAGSLDQGNPASLSPADLEECSLTVRYLGEREDIASVYAQSHIVVLPSYHEGLPKSLVEAAACGRAVVTTDVPGCRDAIQPGDSGLLVPVRDEQALYEAVMRLATDKTLRQAMGRAGRKLAEQRFDQQCIAQQQVALYTSLLNRGA